MSLRNRRELEVTREKLRLLEEKYLALEGAACGRCPRSGTVLALPEDGDQPLEGGDRPLRGECSTIC